MAEAKPRRAVDPELQAAAKIDRILSELDEKAIERVIVWLASKHRGFVAFNPCQPVEAKE